MVDTIHNEYDYANAIARVEALLDSEVGSPESEEFDELMEGIADWEQVRNSLIPLYKHES